MLSRGLNGKETGEGTGICPRDVLCIDCVRVLNGSFSASFLVGDPDEHGSFVACIYLRCVLHLLHLCSSFTLCVCHIVFCIYCVCFLNLFYLSAVLFSTFIVFVFFNIIFMLSISIYVCIHTYS